MWHDHPSADSKDAMALETTTDWSLREHDRDPESDISLARIPSLPGDLDRLRATSGQMSEGIGDRASVAGRSRRILQGHDTSRLLYRKRHSGASDFGVFVLIVSIPR